MPILRTYRYRELFPAVSITVLPNTMKERLLQEPTLSWLRHSDPRIAPRILSGLCSPADVPTLGVAEASSLLEQDLISAILSGKDERYRKLSTRELEAALRFFAFQRGELLPHKDLEGYHERHVEIHRYLVFDVSSYTFPDPLRLDVHERLRELGCLHAFLALVDNFDSTQFPPGCSPYTPFHWRED